MALARIRSEITPCARTACSEAAMHSREYSIAFTPVGGGGGLYRYSFEWISLLFLDPGMPVIARYVGYGSVLRTARRVAEASEIEASEDNIGSQILTGIEFFSSPAVAIGGVRVSRYWNICAEVKTWFVACGRSGDTAESWEEVVREKNSIRSARACMVCAQASVEYAQKTSYSRPLPFRRSLWVMPKRELDESVGRHSVSISGVVGIGNASPDFSAS